MKQVGKIGVVLLTAVAGFLLCASKAYAGQPTDLIINEIYSRPDGVNTEFVELFNPTDDEIDLSNYSIEDGTHKPAMLSGSILPQQYYVAEKGPDFTFSLNDDGDIVILRNAGVIVNTVSYGKWDGDMVNPDNNAAAPPLGKSITRDQDKLISGIDKNDFIIAVPTKGGAYTRQEYSDQLIINEFVPSPAEGSDFEFIELFNASLVDIGLENWILDDVDGGSTPYLFTKGAEIKSGCLLVLYKNETGITLNDSGDSVRLIDPNGEVKSEVKYDSAKRGYSYSLINDEWRWSLSLTPGSKNIFEEEVEESQIILLQNIEEAKTCDEGTNVTVSGTVITTPGQLSNQYFYIQDSTGGVQIYFYSGNFPELKPGYFITVRGEISNSNGEKRIKISLAADIAVVCIKDPVPPSNKKLSELVDNDVGTYIRVSGKLIKNSGNYLTINDGADLQIVIRDSTGIKKPKMKSGQIVQVEGVLSTYNNSLRILPFGASGVTILTSGSLPITGADEGVYLCKKLQITQAKQEKSLIQSRLSCTAGICCACGEIWEAEKRHQLHV